MHFTTTAILATLISLAMSEPAPAAAVPTPVFKCAAQSILDACLSSMKDQMEDCTPNNWKCLCEQSNNVLTCYNNCPNHPDQFGISQENKSYCNAYKANSLLYSSSSTTTSTPTQTGGSRGPADTTGTASASPTVSLGAAPGLTVGLGSMEGAMLMALGWVLASSFSG